MKIFFYQLPFNCSNKSHWMGKITNSFIIILFFLCHLTILSCCNYMFIATKRFFTYSTHIMHNSNNYKTVFGFSLELAMAIHIAFTAYYMQQHIRIALKIWKQKTNLIMIFLYIRNILFQRFRFNGTKFIWKNWALNDVNTQRLY